MTWEELTDVLIGFGERVHVVRGDGLDAVSLQLVPIAWFISVKSVGTLSIGTYEGNDNRLVGGRSIPLEELTPEFVKEEVGKALAKQVATLLNPETIEDFLRSRAGQNPRFPNRDEL